MTDNLELKKTSTNHFKSKNKKFHVTPVKTKKHINLHFIPGTKLWRNFFTMDTPRTKIYVYSLRAVSPNYCANYRFSITISSSADLILLLVLFIVSCESLLHEIQGNWTKYKNGFVLIETFWIFFSFCWCESFEWWKVVSNKSSEKSYAFNYIIIRLKTNHEN